MINNKRNMFLDELRGYAITLVVIGHILQYVLKVPFESFFFSLIYSFHMAFFMFLSGYSMSLGHKELSAKYIFNRMVHLIIPFFVWCSLHNYTCILKFDLKTFFNIFLYPVQGLWFLWVLAFINFFVYVGQKINKILRKDILGYIIVAGALTFITYTGFKYFAFDLISLHFIFFLFGYKLNEYYVKYSDDCKICIRLFGSILFVNLIVYWRFPNIFIIEDVLVNSLHELYVNCFIFCYVKIIILFLKRYIIQLCGTIFIISVYLFFRKYCNNYKLRKFFSILGIHSIDIYIMHFFILKYLQLFRNAYINSIITFFMGIILPIGAGFLIRKNKYSAFLLLGKKLV